jgi:hypothetical protein
VFEVARSVSPQLGRILVDVEVEELKELPLLDRFIQERRYETFAFQLGPVTVEESEDIAKYSFTVRV